MGTVVVSGCTLVTERVTARRHLIFDVACALALKRFARIAPRCRVFSRRHRSPLQAAPVRHEWGTLADASISRRRFDGMTWVRKMTVNTS
jgi:hypothetical protein